MTPVLVLVGAPGAGKTTVGQQVAEQLGVAFRDTDTDIESAAGKSVADIFITDREATFRELERGAVAAAVRDHHGVLALGGGAVLDAQTRAVLADHRVVWLEVSLSEATKRVGLARERPVLALNPRATLARLLEERAPHYAEVADVRVSTDGRTVEEIAGEVAAAVALEEQ